MKKEEYFISVGVGNYQLCFDKHFVLPLNHLNSDKIIFVNGKKFIDLRNVTIDPKLVEYILNNNLKNIDTIFSNHIMQADGIDKKLITSKFTGCKLVKLSYENSIGECSTLRALIEFEEVDMMYKVEEK